MLFEISKYVANSVSGEYLCENYSCWSLKLNWFSKSNWEKSQISVFTATAQNIDITKCGRKWFSHLICIRLTWSWYFFNRNIWTGAGQSLLLYTSQSAIEKVGQEFFISMGFQRCCVLREKTTVSYFFLFYKHSCVILWHVSVIIAKSTEKNATYRLSVTKVPVNFLHRRNADSNRSGSSVRNFSSRTTFSISFDNTFRSAFCNIGKRIFNSATVLLKSDKYTKLMSFILSISCFLCKLFLPSTTKDQCHILNGSHIHTCPTIYHFTTQYFHRSFQIT